MGRCETANRECRYVILYTQPCAQHARWKGETRKTSFRRERYGDAVMRCGGQCSHCWGMGSRGRNVDGRSFGGLGGSRVRRTVYNSIYVYVYLCAYMRVTAAQPEISAQKTPTHPHYTRILL